MGYLNDSEKSTVCIKFRDIGARARETFEEIKSTGGGDGEAGRAARSMCKDLVAALNVEAKMALGEMGAHVMFENAEVAVKTIEAKANVIEAKIAKRGSK